MTPMGAMPPMGALARIITEHLPEKKIEEGHSIERVWYNASREPPGTLPGSQPCTQTRSVYHTPYYQGFSLL